MKLHHIFVKYCMRYFLAFLVVLLCCVLLATVSYNSIENYIIEVNELNLDKGGDEIRQNIAKFDLITQVLRQDPSFRMISQVDGRIPSDQYLGIKRANDRLVDIGLIDTFAAYSFALFRDNDIYLSSSQCTANFDEYFGSLFEVGYDGVTTADAFQAELFARLDRGSSFWRVDSIRFYSGGAVREIENAILYTIRENMSTLSDTPYVIVLVLDPLMLRGRFVSGESLAEVNVRLADSKTGELLIGGADDEQAGAVSAGDNRPIVQQIPELNWEVTVTIPEAVIHRQGRDIVNLLLFYIFVGVALVLVLTFYFSYRQYVNVRKLFSRLPYSGEKRLDRRQNEYDVLSRMLADVKTNTEEYQSRIEELTRQNRAILLETLLVHGVHTQEDIARIGKDFPHTTGFYCVAVVSMRAEDPEQLSVPAFFIAEYLGERYPHAFYNVHTGLSDEVFLLSLSPDEATNVDGICDLFEGITAILTDDTDVEFRVGVSGIGTGIANIHACYSQARQVVRALDSAGRNTVTSYYHNIGAVRENMVNAEFTEKLYNLLLSAEWEAIRKQFGQLIFYHEKNPFHWEALKQQIFFSIRNIIYCAYLHHAADNLQPSFLPAYHDSDSARQMFTRLEDAAGIVCSHVDGNKKSRNEDLKVRIMSYMRENFASPSLTPASISREMGISEKYLYHFVKEQTGETVAGLLERIRIETASDYLKNTDLSNEKIAKAVGFVAMNTFYRVFKGRTGVSPGTYRDSHIG